MPFFIGTIQIILLASHWVLYLTIKRFFSVVSPRAILKLRIIFLFLAFSLILSSLISFRYFGFLARFFYVFSVTWLGLAYFLLLASLLCWLIYFVSEVFKFRINLKILAVFFLFLVAGATVFGMINASATGVTQITVKLPNLPSAWQGKKAVWVSDTHLGQVRGKSFAQKIADMVKAQSPDILFIGGDFFDGSAVDTDGVADPFEGLNIPKGTYFITGNHEQFSGDGVFKEAVQKAGMKILNNETVEVDGLQIAGVDYRATASKPAFEQIMQNQIKLDKDKPSILLKHTPFDLDVSQKFGVSLQLSGHTHQGQLFLFKYITRLIYKGYDYGLKNFGQMTGSENSADSSVGRIKDMDNAEFLLPGMQVYTSSGAGTWGPPMRIDTKPEIVVVEFR